MDRFQEFHRWAPTHRPGTRPLTGVVTAAKRLTVLVAVIAVLLVATPNAQAAPDASLASNARSGLDVGGMVNGWDDQFPAGQHLEIADAQFSAVTALMFMGWEQGWETPGQQNIRHTGLDDVVEWAKETPGRNKTVHGHVLLYPKSNMSLPWFQNASNHEALLETYISRIASSNAGQVDVWHVVNEVFADPQWETPGDYGLRRSYKEYESIGPSYVEKAFDWARDADPDATLIINEYGAAAEGPKADALFDYVTAKRAAGVPIDGIGFQMHLTGHTTEPDYDSIVRNLQRFADAGLRLFITELDVAARVGDTEVPPSPEQRARQARIYERIAQIASEQPAVEALMLWDFVDNRSWLHPAITTLGTPEEPWNYVPEGSYTYPTPWSGGRSQTATANDNYEALRRGLNTAPTVEPAVPDGPVWLSSRWDSQSSYLARSGVFDGTQWYPVTRTQLIDRTPSSERWQNMRWVFEPAGDGAYRIRNQWGNDGYLTRKGEWNGTGWDPAEGLHLHERVPYWSSQLWRVEPLADGSLRLTNQWAPESGVLTRVGLPAIGGGYNPSRTVALYPANAAWSSQSWDATAAVTR